jgi:MoaA/NifB/PqqE/SkfB family radical SAM enzyme
VHEWLAPRSDARSSLGVDFDRAPFTVIWEVTRARAYATTGDALAEDPLCAYVPRRTGRRLPRRQRNT